MQAYFWTKTAHVVFVIAWMAGVFYLPRILVNIAEAGDAPAVRARLVLMGRRLYRFGHVMFGLAVALGLALWLHSAWAAAGCMPSCCWWRCFWRISPLPGAGSRARTLAAALPSSRTLRWFNELPVVLLVAIVYLVLAKPF